MTRRLIVECGVSETRSALLQDNDVLRFWFGPARGDERLPRPAETGDIFLGRVRSVSIPLDAAFIDIGCGVDGFLPLKKSGAPVEGAKTLVKVRRPAIGAKGAVLSTDLQKGMRGNPSAIEKEAESLTAPSRIEAWPDAAAHALRFLDPATVDEIVIDSGEAAASVSRAANGAVKIRVDQALFRTYEIEDAIAAALERVVALAGGGRLIFDETEAMTLVDVDSGSLADGASRRLNDAVNAAAAGRLFHELSRRSIGGKIVVDFLPPSNAKARAALLDHLDQAARGVMGGRAGKLAADGMFDFTCPKESPSLLDRATEPAGCKTLIRSGRGLTARWNAHAAVRELSARLASAPAAQLTLMAGPELAAYISRQARWTDRLAAIYGARFKTVNNSALEDRSFHVASR